MVQVRCTFQTHILAVEDSVEFSWEGNLRLNSIIHTNNHAPSNSTNQTEHFSFTETDFYKLILLNELSVNGYPLEPGDEVGVFCQLEDTQFPDSSICVGAVVYDGTPWQGIQAWADENYNQGQNGYISDFPIQYRIWDSSTDTETEITDVEYIEFGDWDTTGTFSGFIVSGVNLSHQPEIEMEYFYTDNWNLLSLPLNVSDSHYQSLFPDAIPGTLYGYDDGYQNESELIPGKGYWLRFPSSGSTSIIGEVLPDTSIYLQGGWNLVSGFSEEVNVNDIIDEDGIIVANTWFGYDNAYFNAQVLIPGNAYWVYAITEGLIIIPDGNDRMR